jgi:hypothetical protein
MALTEASGLGYKTGIAFWIVATYLLGLVLIQITETFCSLLAQKIWPARGAGGYDDPYWRHLMREYLGATRSPDAMVLDNNAATKVIDNVLKRSPQAYESKLRVTEQLQEMLVAFEKKQAEIAGLPEGPEKTKASGVLNSLKFEKKNSWNK